MPDAHQGGDARCVEHPHGADAEREKCKRMWKAQLAPQQHTIEGKKANDEADALVARAFPQDAHPELAHAEDLPAYVEDDVVFIERQDPVRDA